ncbi:hypothetical protein BC936DRAFT_149501 [Jimgerdemannia flammicorona]|uniref:THUMP domain-containing protein n=1 Tax=Jimgerdemannia flammicorona TaxID=994334 RepID=A0A433DJY4_9FUNG|nr:hypothetical protein BC936DRAFT_149501 [Jimgerdemannia flammicorona]
MPLIDSCPTSPQRNRLRQLLTHDPFDPHPILSKKSRHQRASIFANFLVEKFGVPFLNSGSGVLDVAGGKGDIELELTRLGIRCTLVEPRDDVWEEAGDERIRKKKNGKEVRLKKDKKKIHGHGGPEPHNLFFTHLNTILPPADDPAFPLDPPLAEALRTCSILIGLHPDAATDSIVDHALANEKSFAIIPCCVFKHTNEERRQWKENGAEREVSTYEDLCEYLYWKVRTVSGNTRTIKREWVEFVGRNTVLLGRRFIPLDYFCAVTLEDIQTTARHAIELKFPFPSAASLTNLEDLPKSTVAIVIEIRNNQTIKKEDILRTVADFIPSHCKVQLTNPDFVILVSVFKSMCGLSIIPDYYKHRKYNMSVILNDVGE